MRLFEYERATELMRSAGIDLILASSKSNVSYLLDYYADPCNASMELDDGSMYYQSFAGLPADEQIPPFFTPWIGEVGYMTATRPWVQDRRVYGELLNIPGLKPKENPVGIHPVDCATQAIEDRKMQLGCIGVEKTRMPIDAYKRLRSSLPDARFVDATRVLSKLRAVKSSEEIERLRCATLVTEQAIRAGYDCVGEGTTELQFTRAIEVSLAEQGAECGWIHVAFGPKGARDIMPRDTIAKVGEPLRVDVGGIYSGYVCDMSRVGVLGEPSKELLMASEAVQQSYQAVLGAVRSGASTGELYNLGAHVMESQGFELFMPIVGHGVGRDVHEWPYMLVDSNDYLLSGMTMTVEIEMRLGGVGCINFEDMVLVTETGSEPITTPITTMDMGLWLIQ